MADSANLTGSASESPPFDSVSDNSVPGKGSAAKLLSGWVTGDDKCATRKKGGVQTPSGFCYFWLGLMILGFAAGTLLSARMAWAHPSDSLMEAGQCGTPVSKWRYQLVAVLGTCVGALNLIIFYRHCARCNGWSGFAITLFVSIVWSTAAYHIAPVCTPAELQQRQQ